jgi:hypothetical protein
MSQREIGVPNINSTEVDLYLRASQKGAQEDDPDAVQFLEGFREKITR